MIAIITLILVTFLVILWVLTFLGGRRISDRNDDLMEEVYEWRNHVKDELVAIKKLVAVPSGGIVSPGTLNAMLDNESVLGARNEDEWQELINEGRDDLSR